MKTILQIAADLTPHLSIDVPTALISSQEQENIDLVRCITEAGQEIATRFNWPQMRKKYTITGMGNVAHNLPSDFSRMVQGYAVTVGGVNVRGAVSDEEFNRLAPIAGVPRFYRITPTTIEFWPYLTAPATADIVYQTRNWLSSDKEIPTADDDRPLFEDVLVHKNALFRFRRLKGQEAKDHFDEFEADFARYANFSRGERSP